MAAIKVYGLPISTATMRVLAALYEKDLAFELVPVDMKACAHKQEPFLSLNPFGKVPALQDADLTLFESRAITEYLEEEYSDKGEKLLCPASTKIKAITKVWLHAIYEARLSKSEYLACDCFTLADLHHLPLIHYLMGTDSKTLFESRPKVSDWVKKITARPAWAKVLDLHKQ